MIKQQRMEESCPRVAKMRLLNNCAVTLAGLREIQSHILSWRCKLSKILATVGGVVSHPTVMNQGALVAWLEIRLGVDQNDQVGGRLRT